jgi:zeta-carotene desaturase
MARVIVLGGGLAGLAAAARLAESGYEVEVLEKRPVLGGRASSFLAPGETEPIDNCQHVLLGCCTNLLDFYERTGVAAKIRFYNRYLFLGPKGISSISSSALPAPLHLLPSLLRFRDFTWPDCAAIARAMLAILRMREPLLDAPLSDWLREQRQTKGAIEFFWRVILTSALNEDLERLSTRPAFQVFRESFLCNQRGYRMGIPTVSLGELYASKQLRETCSLQTEILASEILLSDHAVRGLRLRNGEMKQADFYVSSIPPDALNALLPASPWTALERLACLDWSPITGVHLWFESRVMELPYAAVLGRTIQWIFNKSAISRKADAPQYLQLVISASRNLVPMKREEVLELMLGELRELLPKARAARLLKAVVVKETKSTLSFPAGTDDWRPGPQTPFRNLFLAGDWTASGWPPTMEGAVRSGYRAAEEVTRAAGNPRRFLVPDLQLAPLARLMGCR